MYHLYLCIAVLTVSNVIFAAMFIRAANNYGGALETVRLYVPHVYATLFGDLAKE